jgi:hypothetical protein
MGGLRLLKGRYGYCLSSVCLYAQGLPRSWARSPITFFLDEKSNKKIKSAKRLLCAQGPLPGSSAKTSGCKIFAPLCPLLPAASAKNCYAPPGTLRPPVLPALTRSFFADGFAQHQHPANINENNMDA